MDVQDLRKEIADLINVKEQITFADYMELASIILNMDTILPGRRR